MGRENYHPAMVQLYTTTSDPRGNGGVGCWLGHVLPAQPSLTFPKTHDNTRPTNITYLCRAGVADQMTLARSSTERQYVNENFLSEFQRLIPSTLDHPRPPVFSERTMHARGREYRAQFEP
jgi:hypothetical protein